MICHSRFKAFALQMLCLTLLIFLFMQLSGCTEQGSGNEGDKIRVGYIPIAECMPLFVAQENGYFEEEKLSVEIMQFPGGAQTLEALSANSIDIAFSNLVSLVFASAAGLDFVAVWGSTIEDKDHVLHGLVVQADSEYVNPPDLTDKSIAVNTLKNIDELLLTLFFERQGIPRDRIKLVEVPFPNMPAVLENGDVQAIAVVEPFLTISTTQRNGRVLAYYFVDALGKVWITSYCTKRSWVDSHKSELEKFENAMGRAVEFCRDNEIAARKILTKYTSLTPDLANSIHLPVFSNELPTKSGIEAQVDAMVRIGWIKKTVSSKDVLYAKQR
jgi:NitT/TauT family transport system substrate-binding protein